MVSCLVIFTGLTLNYSLDFTERWVAEENWTYTADLAPFFTTVQPSPNDQTLLVFYGIDTIANIVRSPPAHAALILTMCTDVCWTTRCLGE
jgi:hypothetical protein